MMLLDSDVFIDYLRGHAPALAFFRSISSDPDIFFSTITEAELVSGGANDAPSVRERLVHFIHRWEDVAPDHQIAVRAGDLRRNLGMGLADALIAATALHLRAELVTRNASDFKKVPGLRVKIPY